jgi:UDP-N-acetyl-2-amino-2-deoxyglucuronate dehydrogenase
LADFALVGAAGYVAPRHMQAIRDTGNRLVAALDPCDSVGILDSYFPDCVFFTEPVQFSQFLQSHEVDWLSIACPNNLHSAYCQMGMHAGANIICEKPLVIRPQELEDLRQVETETGKRVYTLMQLRHSPEIHSLWAKFHSPLLRHQRDAHLAYITPRGPWYSQSWKANKEKSGGIIYNIGIHMLDLLLYFFGDVHKLDVHTSSSGIVRGLFEFDKIDLEWLVSIYPQRDLYDDLKQHRILSINGSNFDLSFNFKDLHTTTYRKILTGHGLGIDEAAKSILLADRIVHG